MGITRVVRRGNTFFYCVEILGWKEAGFAAAVVESNNHFSVALGRYATISEAQLFAEQMWEAFENGYFIGRMKIL